MTTPRIKAITVNIMEKDYSVACPQGEEATLLEAVEQVDQVMQRIKRAGRTVGMESIAVMAALNMAHELLTYKRQEQEKLNACASEPNTEALNASSSHTEDEAKIAQQLQTLTKQIQKTLRNTQPKNLNERNNTQGQTTKTNTN